LKTQAHASRIYQHKGRLVEGVVEAQKAVKPYGAMVNPRQERLRAGRHTVKPRSESVNFVIEVATADSSSNKQGIGVFVAPIGVDKQGISDTKQTSVGRIQFHVWVEPPPSK
jgi:hypothetical protein